MSRKLPDSMHWQIYQAYLSGPHALFRLFEEAFGRAALYGPPDPDQQQRTIHDLAEHIARLKAQIGKLQAETRGLHYRNFQLGRRNAELEAQLTKDSHNSSRPPSTESTLGEENQEPASPLGQTSGRASRTPRRDAPIVKAPQPCH